MIAGVEVAVGAIVRRADDLLLVKRGHPPGEGGSGLCREDGSSPARC